MKIKKIMENLTFASLIIISLFLFTSMSLSAGFHIFICLPGLYYFTLNYNKFNWPLSLKFLLAFSLFTFLSVISNWETVPHPLFFLSKTKYFFMAILSFFAFHYGLPKLRQIKKQKIILTLFLLSSAMATLSGLYAKWTGFNPLRFRPASHYSRASGMYGMTITYAFSVAALASILSVLYFNRKKIKNVINSNYILLSLIIALVGLFFSSGRGAILGFVFSLPFVFFLRNPRWLFLSLVKISISLVVFVALIKAGFFQEYNQQPDSLGRQLGNQSANVRKVHAQASLYMIKEHPFLGVGFREVEEKIVDIKHKYSLPLSDYRGHAHNNYFEVWAGTGTLGFIAFLGFFISWLVESFRRKDILGDATVAFIVCYSIAGIFHSAIIDGEILFFLFGLYSLKAIKL